MGDVRRRLAPLLFLAGALLASPLQAQLFGGDETARKQVAEQAKRVDALSGRIDQIDETLKSMASSNPALELAQQLERLRQEIAQLRGQIEVANHETQEAARRQRDMYVDIDTRLKRLEQTGVAATAAAGAPGTATPAPGEGAKPGEVMVPAAPVLATEEETRAYEAAQSQRRIGNYRGAIAAFENFIAEYPRSPLAHRAQYWIGDSFYNLREFKAAIASQQKLIANYSGSASVPDALLNIASCQAELGDKAAARQTLDGLVTRYPASDAAEKARRRLATLR